MLNLSMNKALAGRNSSWRSLMLGVAMVATAVSLAGAGGARAETATLTVNGEGSVYQSPDMATINLGVTTTAETAAEALGKNSEAMNAVIERLKAAGIESKDLQTLGLSVNPNWESSSSYSSGSGSKLAGYVATNMLMLRVTDLEKLGPLLDASVADGANTLNGVTFGLIDPRPAVDEARKLAVVDARARAELLAEAAGVKLGPIRQINDGGNFNGGGPVFRADAKMASVPIQQGEVNYQANVSIVWELLQ